jgi:hypothetical protein
MQVNDKIAHVRIVYRSVSLRLPGREGAGDIREYANNVELRRIAKGDAMQFFKLAAKDQMQKLFLLFVHVVFGHGDPFEAALARARL